jgi:endonuclease/exonuclease/phosphatase family metal-dependent hydrolase
VDVPGIGETVVYVCHFKSPGAAVPDSEIDAIEDWEGKVKAYLNRRMEAGVNQVLKRTTEAGLIYRKFREALEKDINAPVVLLGDLNDVPESYTIGILTQAEKVSEWGSEPAENLPETLAGLEYAFRLYDSWMLSSSQDGQRPATHGGEYGSVLDYAIVSNGLNGNNPDCRGAVVGLKVYDQHLLDGTDERVSSDHAPVVMTVEARARTR